MFVSTCAQESHRADRVYLFGAFCRVHKLGQVRTLFVSGLPMDAKPRELYLLFRAYKGYEGSLLKVTSKNGKTSSPVGFVTFSTRAGAEAAKQELQ
ncbi:hypothetical protein BIW11_09903, partial [Tropilaelaps mercedesae]